MPPLPTPEHGLVIAYGYLWHHERERGVVEGRKIRPAVVVLVTQANPSVTKVLVAPITHSPPTIREHAVEIPASVRHHLKLDDSPSWIVCTELNEFLWPGFDLRPIAPGGRFDYGLLPPRLYEAVRDRILELVKQRMTKMTSRD